MLKWVIYSTCTCTLHMYVHVHVYLLVHVFTCRSANEAMHLQKSVHVHTNQITSELIVAQIRQ